MKNRLPALLSTLSNTFCDFTLDIAINKYSMYQILFGTALGSFFLQIIYGFVVGFDFTLKSLIIVLLYGLMMLCGYVFYVLSLKKLPISLTGLIESGNLFIILFIDAMLGIFKITPLFLVLFIVFVFSIYLFSFDSIKFKTDIKNKSIQMSGILLLLLSMAFYITEPYLIQMASNYGANEIVVNIGYYVVALPYFFFMMKRHPKNNTVDNKEKKKMLGLILLISLLESLYFLFGTMGYMAETPIINAIIHEIRVFLLVILSMITKTDKMTIKKGVAVFLGIISIIAIYCI